MSGAKKPAPQDNGSLWANIGVIAILVFGAYALYVRILRACLRFWHLHPWLVIAGVTLIVLALVAWIATVVWNWKVER